MITENKISNRINDLFRQKNKILSIYFTAGYPLPDDTEKIIMLLQQYGADMIEVGIPFSDSLLDGPSIQHSNTIAIENGMTLELLFHKLKSIKDKVKIPLVLMGSMNPTYQYGMDRFCQNCNEAGIDGTIIPDMPLKEFNTQYRKLYSGYNLSNIFMVTPQTPEERIRLADEISEGFIYLVSSSSTTGNKEKILAKTAYFSRIQNMELKNPCLVGFNINEKEDFNFVSQFSQGAIVGTAFIRALAGEGDLEEKVRAFMESFGRTA